MMKRAYRYRHIILVIALAVGFGGFGLQPAWALTTQADICSAGQATPPFLAGGVDPNLLLVIDNSASMLDLAYVDADDNNYCVDDSYDNSATYAGYFESGTIYVYDTASKQFRSSAAYPAIYNSASADDTYSTAGVLYVKMTGTSGVNRAVTAFKASGNLLNWAASSKLDIQKKILTGGKYDDPNDQLILESRGCLERRMIKKVLLTHLDGVAATNYLTMAVRPPLEEFPNWTKSTVYSVGDVVNESGDLYKCALAGTSGTVSVDEDTAAGAPQPSWIIDIKHRWTSGAPYVIGDIVSDPYKANTVDEGQMYIATSNGTATGTTGVNGDTGVSWTPYNLSHIEIFEATATGFDNAACQDAVYELSIGGSAGVIKQDIKECMDYQISGGNQGDYSNYQAAFNHSIHNCWYAVKHSGAWPPGQGPVNNIKPACEAIYPVVDPWAITPEHPAYVCFGVHTGDPATDDGYVGRCWQPASGTPVCVQWDNKDPSVCKKYDNTASGGGWDATGAGYGSLDDCLEQALRDFCGVMEIPDVVDPSDQVVADPYIWTDADSDGVVDPGEVVSSTAEGDVVGDTGELWNMPAMLTDSGVVSQLGQPLLVMKGLIEKTSAPSGLIQKYSDDIRMGAMVFNYEGSKGECASLSNPYVLFECTSASNRDGSMLISAIAKSSAHTTALVSALNDIKATSWTPIAEAIFNAIGYYAQRSDMRLDSNDFAISATDDPITDYCQDNNILVITEGASTADVNTSVVSFVSTAGQNDDSAGTDTTVDTLVSPFCGNLSGSTLLDDLAWFAKNSSSCHTTQILDAEGNLKDKQNIATHIVVAGTLRDTGATDECNPKVLLEQAAANGGTQLYTATNPQELENKLEDAFAAIRAGAAAGSAASVISASRSGEGAAYQAIFWPSVELASGDTVDWIGEVHSLLVDSYGYLHQDTNGDHALDSGDDRVIFFFDENINQTKGCIGELDSSGACVGTTLSLEDVKYHWSAARWLSEITPVAAVATATGSEYILQNRTVVNPGSTTSYINNTKKRLIFTWNDLDNDGVVDSGEVLDFVPGTTWSGLSVDASRGPVTLDFGVQTNAEVDDIIQWVRGLDETSAGQRLRQMPYDFDHDTFSTQVTWRLGDVIHSTPLSVAAPSEGFQFLYRDASYANFVAAYKKRRHMVYFGGNDGMLHAVNGGFYDEGGSRFCRTVDCAGDQNVAPELGAELWAYVPYNLLPHLRCMTVNGYQHKYFVDQRPRIFDVKIWPSNPDDGIHTDGWGTILVGAMRYGGARIEAGNLDIDNNGAADYTDNRKFASSYFIMDITDPERQPTLLAEMTSTGSQAEMGYTLGIPTLAVMKDGSAYKWYLVMGSGPTDVDGSSDQNANLAVFPLSRLVTSGDFRIPNVLPAASDEFGRFQLADSHSFISDLISVDYELDQDYMTDVIYFGTVDDSPADASDDWGGSMYRLVTRKLDSGDQVATLPHEWSSLLTADSLSNPLKLIHVGQPVTAAASVGTDGKNYWVYFGTGRFLDTDDKSDDSTQAYYGIKEPLSFPTDGSPCVGSFTWQTVEKTDVNDGHHNSTPGDQWLLRVDQINVAPAATGSASTLSCDDGTTACLEIPPTTLGNFDSLLTYIVGTGTGCDASDSSGTDGWYKNFTMSKERNVGQATLLGGLVTYTTYQPYSDACLPEGLGYLYGVYYQTGTPYYIPVFLSDYSTGVDAEGNVIDQVALGRGLATTPNLHTGKQEGSKAFVQTSTGTIVEIPQPNLPIQNAKTGKSSWGEVR